MIRPLTEERACITDKILRRRMAVRIAEEHHTTSRRVLRLYYTFLAHGTIQLKRKARKPKREEQKKIFAAAIERYYLSAKRPSLRDAYDCLLYVLSIDEEGKLLPEYPSWHSFRSIITAVGCTKRAIRSLRGRACQTISATTVCWAAQLLVEGSARQLSDGCNTGGYLSGQQL